MSNGIEVKRVGNVLTCLGCETFNTGEIKVAVGGNFRQVVYLCNRCALDLVDKLSAVLAETK